MKRNLTHVYRTAALILIVSATGCAKKAKPDMPDSGPTASTGSENGLQGHDSDSGNAMGLVTIHFSFDSNSIDGAQKQILEKDAAILKKNLGLHVQVEGHCDERGGAEYNLALGDRRANQVKKLLTEMGVPSSRVATISMGKEKPLVTGDSEEAYSTNRRANFVITSNE